MIRRTIYEGGRLNYGNEKCEIEIGLADQLAKVARASSFSKATGGSVLDHGREYLRARNAVGVVATPHCQLEILPKIEKSDDDNREGPKEQDRDLLMQMLSVVWDLEISASKSTPLGWQQQTILEILIRLFCTKLLSTVRQGMPQQYIDYEDDLSMLRERLNVTRQFTTLAVSPHKLASQFTERSFDTTLNQAMRATVRKLTVLSQAHDNQRNLRELSFMYADIAEIQPNQIRWDLIVLDRTNSQWRELVNLARILLGDHPQNTRTGEIDGYALLFDMPKLFERYVARLYQREYGDRVRVQKSLDKCCLYEHNKKRFTTLPDLIITTVDYNDPEFIVDTKWKRLSDSANTQEGGSDSQLGVDRSDVHTMMAYSQVYSCENVALLYPHHSDLKDKVIRRRFQIGETEAEDTLSLVTLDIREDKKKQQCALRSILEYSANGISPT